MIALGVPSRNSLWSGTGTVIVVPRSRFCIMMWLPFRRISAKPFAARIAQTARPDSTRSLANRNLKAGHKYVSLQPRFHLARISNFKKEFDGFLKICSRILDAFALACDIQLRAQSYIPVSFTFNDSC